ncbi:site-2 protease family protein [Conyzicola nivalis]|uniref:Peptidase n=1 Tax=Conyzicola nivalis TaxID=1477021 RepID=A0A916SDM1_9MICO|nr:site-2 protease family protein [Conyzicola nivalis]GGA92564.1 peptidase [Conyzicola nivalis]
MESVLLYVLGILVVVVGLALSIGLHEVGHLLPAKLFGVRVGQYMIGFGPTLWSRRFGETEYGLKAIPMGGYISMAGMYPPAKDGTVSARTASTGFFQTLVQDARTASAETVVVGQEERVFYRLAVWKRIVIMLGGPVMNLLIGIVLYAVLLMGFGAQQVSTTIGSVSECVVSQTSESTDGGTECSAGDTEAPGAAAGILPGDKLVSLDGTTITEWDQATAIIRDSAGDDLTIVVERDGETVTLTSVPLLTERYVYDADGAIVEDSDGNSVTEEVGFLGIGPAYETVKQPITAVLPAVGDNIGRVGHMILNLPERLVDVVNAAFGTEERDPNGPISVVGVGRLAGEISSLDTIPIVDKASGLIGLLASLNIALFVFNLVPLMPLDGGHVAGALWEGIRRFFAKLFGRKDPGPVDIAKLVPLTLVVVVLLGSMSALLIYADLVKPISIL